MPYRTFWERETSRASDRPSDREGTCEIDTDNHIGDPNPDRLRTKTKQTVNTVPPDPGVRRPTGSSTIVAGNSRGGSHENRWRRLASGEDDHGSHHHRHR